MAYVFVLGGPGAGKGTQCSLLAKEFNFQHLSAGALLREFIAQGGPEADELGHMMNNQGKIVPAHITVRLLIEAMHQSQSQLCLIDGFPRNTDNVQAWDRAAPSSCQFVLNFAAPLDILQKRLLSRADGSRSDDNEQTILKRFHTFEDSTKPVIKHFEAMGKLHTVDAAAEINDVYQATRQHFINLLEKD